MENNIYYYGSDNSKSYIKEQFAFIYKGKTYELNQNTLSMEIKWASMKTVVDPDVERIIKEKGTREDEITLFILAGKVQEFLIQNFEKDFK